MIDIAKLPLEQRVRIYAYGDKYNEIPPRAFDLTTKDAETLLSACEIVRMLARRDCPHNFQLERSDLVEYCYAMTALQTMARGVMERMGDDGKIYRE